MSVDSACLVYESKAIHKAEDLGKCVNVIGSPSLFSVKTCLHIRLRAVKEFAHLALTDSLVFHMFSYGFGNDFRRRACLGHL